jgi:hypothetical protein
MPRFVQISEEEMRSLLRSGKRGPDFWAYQGEWVAVYLVAGSSLAVKVYTSVRRDGVAAPSGEDAIRVCVVDKEGRETFNDARGVASLPIVRRVAGWDERLKGRIRVAFKIAYRERDRVYHRGGHVVTA